MIFRLSLTILMALSVGLLATHTHAKPIVGRIVVGADSDASSGYVRLRCDNGQQQSTRPLRDGSFTLDAPSPSSSDSAAAQCTVRAVYTEYAFAALRVTWSDESEAVQVRAVSGSGAAVPYPIEWAPVRRTKYYEPAPTFSFVALLRNPMLLIMLAMGGMSFVLPKMMDQEAYEDFKKASSGPADEQCDALDAALAQEQKQLPPPKLFKPTLSKLKHN